MARRAFENRSADGAEPVRRLDSDDDDDDGDGAKRRKTNRGGGSEVSGAPLLGAAAATATLASVVPASKPRPAFRPKLVVVKKPTPTTNASNASNALKGRRKTTATKAREGRATGSVYSAGTARTVDDGRFSVVCTELLTTTRVCVFQTVPSYASFTRARARPAHLEDAVVKVARFPDGSPLNPARRTGTRERSRRQPDVHHRARGQLRLAAGLEPKPIHANGAGTRGFFEEFAFRDLVVPAPFARRRRPRIRFWFWTSSSAPLSRRGRTQTRRGPPRRTRRRHRPGPPRSRTSPRLPPRRR